MTYTATKLFRTKSVPWLADQSIYSAPGLIEVKQLCLNNASSSPLPLGLGLIDAGNNMLDPQDSAPTTGVGSWVPTAATGTASGGLLVLTASGGPVSAFTGRFAISPLTSYYLSAAISTAVTPESVVVSVNWFAAEGGAAYPQAAGSLISSSALTTTADAVAPVTVSGAVTSPAGAYYAQILYTVAAAEAASEVHSLGSVIFAAGTVAPAVITRTLALDRFFPDLMISPGYTELDMSLVLNPGDSITALSTFPTSGGISIYGTGVAIT
jgi:hypothetical protein